jgi:hypothetical protein
VVAFFLRIHECKSQRWCFAKKAVAFFKISLSSLSWAFSRRSRFALYRLAALCATRREELPTLFSLATRLDPRLTQHGVA